jgi:hypothetical protein
VKIYSATSSLVRFKNRNIFFYFEKNALALLGTTLALYVTENSGVVGLAPEKNYLQKNLHSYLFLKATTLYPYG